MVRQLENVEADVNSKCTDVFYCKRTRRVKEDAFLHSDPSRFFLLSFFTQCLHRRLPSHNMTGYLINSLSVYHEVLFEIASVQLRSAKIVLSANDSSAEQDLMTLLFIVVYT